MSRLSTFFKGGDVEFGVFYPKHCLVAVFEKLADAISARQSLAEAGFTGEDDVVAVPGDEVLAYAENHAIKDGLWGLLMTELSRLFATEAFFADKDLAAARRGAAFLAVHCATDREKARAWKALEPRHPFVARYYSLGGIEHLAGEKKTT